MVPGSPASPNCRLSSDTYVASGDKDALSVIQVRYEYLSINPTSVQELAGRVSDPYSFDPDQDPAFRLNTNPDPDPGVLVTKIEKKFTALKN